MSDWYDNLSKSAQKQYMAWKKHKRGAEKMTTEIWIEEGEASCCWRERGRDNMCAHRGKQWVTGCGEQITNLCEHHGIPIINAIKFFQNAASGPITITGGYDDDEPKSKLAGAQLTDDLNSLSNSGFHVTARLFKRIFDYLEEERTDGS